MNLRETLFVGLHVNQGRSMQTKKERFFYSGVYCTFFILALINILINSLKNIFNVGLLLINSSEHKKFLLPVPE